MSRKDVLHIPPSPLPPEPRREADSEEDRPTHELPVMTPDSGPDGTPAIRRNPHVVEPQGRPGRYPGVSVT